MIIDFFLIIVAYFLFIFAIICFQTAYRIWKSVPKEYEELRQKALHGEYITDEDLKRVYGI